MTRPASRSLDRPLPRRGFLARALAFVAGGALLGRAGRAHADVQITPEFIGEIRLFAGNFAPSGWARCDGQLVPISTNTALFSVIGNRYGGNGVSTFALPDLRGRLAIHAGTGPGLTTRTLAAAGGAESHTLSLDETPPHTHVARVSSGLATTATPSPSVVPARNAAGIPAWGNPADALLSTYVVGDAGAGQPHSNTQPFLALHFIIALTGPVPTP